MKPEYKLVDWIPIDKICWPYLCSNESNGAIQLLKNNLNEIYWYSLSWNQNNGAIELIKNNWTIAKSKICWHGLSFNKNAIEILKNNIKKIEWKCLSWNENDN